MKIRHLVAETATATATATAASRQAVLDLLRECKLPTDHGFPDRRPTAISGGQQRRVALARPLPANPSSSPRRTHGPDSTKHCATTSPTCCVSWPPSAAWPSSWPAMIRTSSTPAPTESYG
ncbi:hypothetical protein [Streptomyces sp. NPDC020681]|uniref:hypothetical protein n=1 Tax=Streptomyces sp. NPDC020681 TaxID=3365083 RepID=UPI0037A61E4D